MSDDEPELAPDDLLDVRKAMLEHITTQHNAYVEYVQRATQFPINLVLTLNASAIAAIIFFLRGLDHNFEETVVALRTALVFFIISSAFVMLASLMRVSLYNHIAYRKRKILKTAMERKKMGEIVGAFIHEAENDPSGAPIYITIFTIAAFVFFLLGAYCAGGMTFEDVYGLFSWKITYP